MEKSLLLHPNNQQFEKICELEKQLSQKEEIIQKLESENNAMSLRLTAHPEADLISNTPYMNKLINESTALKEINKHLLQEVEILKSKLATFGRAHPAIDNQGSNVWASDVNWKTAKFDGSHSSINN